MEDGQEHDDLDPDHDFDDYDGELTQIALPNLDHPLIYNYHGVNVKFPKPAYKSQQMLMEKVVRGLRNAANCLLESPTGTGKTLALLCPIVAWVENCKQEGCGSWSVPSVEDGPCECDFDTREDCRIIQDAASVSWAKQYPSLIQIRNTAANANSDSMLSDLDTQCESQSQTQSQTCGDNTQDLNEPEPQVVSYPEILKRRYVDEICARCRLKYYKRPSPPKIYYTTRTVSQSRENVKQFMATHYRDSMKMTILASRDKTCIEEAILTKKATLNNQTQNSQSLPAISVDDECSGRRKNFYYNKKYEDEIEEGDKQAKFPICQYFHRLMDMKPDFQKWQADHPVWDIEDLRRDAKDMKMCPYYGASLMHETAQIVFCTYNYLLYKHIRRSSKIDLLNNIVIFDEAHNIENTCVQAMSKTVSYSKLRYVLRKIDESSSKHAGLISDLRAGRETDDDEYNRLVLDIRVYLSRLQNWIVTTGKALNLSWTQPSASARKDFKTEEIKSELENIQLGLLDWMEVETKLKHLEELGGGGEHGKSVVNSDIKIERNTLSFINHLVDVFGSVFGENPPSTSDFVTCLEKKRSRQQLSALEQATLVQGGIQAVGSKKPRIEENLYEFDYHLKILCLNPALGFEYIRKVARTIIVASGTLSPMDALQSELNTKFPIQLSAPHVVPDSNVWVGVVHKSASPAKPSLSLRLVREAQNSEDTQHEIGSIILQICQTVPFGVLVFVPSYAFLTALRTCWTRRPESPEGSALPSILQRLGQTKHIFYETNVEHEFKSTIDNFKRLSISEEGAVLFGVFRGKVSEGVDFKDDQARAVVSLGIPLLNLSAPEVAHKMKYNTEKASNPANRRLQVVQPLNGRQWYEAQGYRALNQGFGRVIRHIGDWGAIFIIEKRFEEPGSAARSRLPRWVSRNALTFDSVESSVRSLGQFVRKKMNDRLETQSL